MNQESFARSMNLIGKLSEIKGLRNEEYTNGADIQNLEFGAVVFSGRAAEAVVGPLKSMNDVAAVDAALKKLGGGVFIPLGGEKGPVLEPSAILGLNAAGKQKDLARQFIAFTLSGEVLENRLGDGFPTNREALAKNMENPFTQEEIDTNQGTYYFLSTSTYEPGGSGTEETYNVYELNALWPDEKFLEDFLAALEGIGTSSQTNEVILEMALEEMGDLFMGKKTVEETADGFARKINLYLAE